MQALVQTASPPSFGLEVYTKSLRCTYSWRHCTCTIHNDAQNLSNIDRRYHSLILMGHTSGSTPSRLHVGPSGLSPYWLCWHHFLSVGVREAARAQSGLKTGGQHFATFHVLKHVWYYCGFWLFLICFASRPRTLRHRFQHPAGQRLKMTVDSFWSKQHHYTVNKGW